jgi:hypothetical protein
MDKKTESVIGPDKSVPELVFNISGKKMPAEYLDRATAILHETGKLNVAGLGNAASNAMKVCFILERLGFIRSKVDISEKLMPTQKWVASTTNPNDGEWVDDSTRPKRPVPQIIITLVTAGKK